jgi:DNA-binding response OmpR family regulator
MARVLVIEDEPAVRHLIGRTLLESGHEVIEAGTARAGLEAARSLQVEMVITDVCLAGSDGIEVMREVRRSYPEVPLIAVSGRDRRELEARLEAAQLRRSVWVVMKPFWREELLGAVREALGR